MSSTNLSEGVTIIRGKIYIDGTPAHEIGERIRLSCVSDEPNEVALCRNCRKIVPKCDMATVRENRQGYFGTCKKCEGGK